ncbi:MAG TPA: hypothetical protein PLH80_01045 [Spirochaetota bacterium]|nr:hypothetical protein [Spirochaetota bacterium]HQI37138.1 hypothetical protein [Spirochaetota bacterium]HQK08203.1 hypothetical protein [Spirochaetota bacterium]
MEKRLLLYLLSLIVIMLLTIGCKKEKVMEIEPNDTYTQSNLIAIGKPIDGFINTESDIDFYCLEVLNPCLLDINVSAVKGVNSAFTIWKESEGSIVPLKYVDDLRKSAPERFCGIYVENGRYYISISHGDKDQAVKNTENPYTLLILEESADGFEKEPNDTILAANPIQIDIPVRGYYSPAFNKANTNAVNPNREEDWFTFYVEDAPVVCDVELSGVAGIEALLDIVDAQGTVLFSSTSQGIGVSQMAKGIGLSVAGNYYIMVAAKNYNANNDVPYSLICTTRNYDNKTEIEPNNIMESATPMVTEIIYGRIYPDNDIDYYQYMGDSSNDVFYRIEINPPMTLDVVSAVYTKKGEEITSINNNGTGDKEVYPNVKLNAPFYVKVWAKRGQVDMDNSYALRIVPVQMGNLVDSEPNDTKEQANNVQGTLINGYISKKHDIDFYVLHYKGRQKKYFSIKAPDTIPISFSVTDSLGYIIQSITVKAGSSNTLHEIVDMKGYCIVKPLNEMYDGLYTIEIKDRP